MVAQEEVARLSGYLDTVKVAQVELSGGLYIARLTHVPEVRLSGLLYIVRLAQVRRSGHQGS